MSKKKKYFLSDGLSLDSTNSEKLVVLPNPPKQQLVAQKLVAQPHDVPVKTKEISKQQPSEIKCKKLISSLGLLVKKTPKQSNICCIEELEDRCVIKIPNKPIKRSADDSNLQLVRSLEKSKTSLNLIETIRKKSSPPKVSKVITLFSKKTPSTLDAKPGSIERSMRSSSNTSKQPVEVKEVKEKKPKSIRTDFSEKVNSEIERLANLLRGTLKSENLKKNKKENKEENPEKKEKKEKKERNLEQEKALALRPTLTVACLKRTASKELKGTDAVNCAIKCKKLQQKPHSEQQTIQPKSSTQLSCQVVKRENLPKLVDKEIENLISLLKDPKRCRSERKSSKKRSHSHAVVLNKTVEEKAAPEPKPKSKCKKTEGIPSSVSDHFPSKLNREIEKLASLLRQPPALYRSSAERKSRRSKKEKPAVSASISNTFDVQQATLIKQSKSEEKVSCKKQEVFAESITQAIKCKKQQQQHVKPNLEKSPISLNDLFPAVEPTKRERDSSGPCNLKKKEIPLFKLDKEKESLLTKMKAQLKERMDDDRIVSMQSLKRSKKEQPEVEKNRLTASLMLSVQPAPIEASKYYPFSSRNKLEPAARSLTHKEESKKPKFDMPKLTRKDLDRRMCESFRSRRRSSLSTIPEAKSSSSTIGSLNPHAAETSIEISFNKSNANVTAQSLSSSKSKFSIKSKDSNQTLLTSTPFTQRSKSLSNQRTTSAESLLSVSSVTSDLDARKIVPSKESKKVTIKKISESDSISADILLAVPSVIPSLDNSKVVPSKESKKVSIQLKENNSNSDESLLSVPSVTPDLDSRKVVPFKESKKVSCSFKKVATARRKIMAILTKNKTSSIELPKTETLETESSQSQSKKQPKTPVATSPEQVERSESPEEILIKPKIKHLGIVETDPDEYMRQYGASLIASQDLPQFILNIKPPEGILLAADQPAKHVYQLEGDVGCLKLVDGAILDREGLSDYKNI